MGWIVIKTKFERGKEYASRRIVSALFDELIAYLIRMKDGGNPTDIEYSQHATATILDAIGQGGLSSLVDFLPSLPLLFDDIAEDNSEAKEAVPEDSLAFSLSKILEAVLRSDRTILCFCDDLHVSCCL